MSLRLDTLSFLPQGSMESVEVLGCFTGQIVNFSDSTQIPKNHLNLKNYRSTLTIVSHPLLCNVLPILWTMVVRMLLFLWISNATGTPRKIVHTTRETREYYLCLIYRMSCDDSSLLRWIRRIQTIIIYFATFSIIYVIWRSSEDHFSLYIYFISWLIPATCEKLDDNVFVL